MCSLPPLPGVTPPTSLVPYSNACSEWKVPWWPVKPWQMTLVFLLTSTLMSWSPLNSCRLEASTSVARRCTAFPAHATTTPASPRCGDAAPLTRGGRQGALSMLPRTSRSFGGRDGFLRGVVQIIGGRDPEPGIAQQLAALLDVGAFETHHHRYFEADFLDRRDDSLGDQVAADDAAEDVDEDAVDPGRGQDQLERGRDPFLGRAATDVEEVRRFSTRQLDHVHGRHRESRAVDHATDVAVHRDVVEVFGRGFGLGLVFLGHIAHRGEFGMPELSVVVGIDLAV